jgi:plasmid maintenance system antidote protein VapI
MDNTPAQLLLFNHLKSAVASHVSFVDEIAELLGISNDSAYRRIRGEKPISLDEVQVLCNNYKVSMDQLLNLKNNTVLFSGNRVDHISFRFNNYLLDITDNLLLFKTFKNAQIYFFNKDIPIFHFMQFPELSAFKFFFWKRTLIGYPELARQKFNGETSTETIGTAESIIRLYTEIPSTEIWTEESIHVTIRQIEFYRHTNIFSSNELILQVYTQLEELLNHLELQAEAGRKCIYNQPAQPNGAPYHVYVNECLLGDNTIFVKGDDRQIAYLNHNGLNFMGTQDNDFCNYTLKNLQNIISKSTYVSLVGEKERGIFFNNLREKIHQRKKGLVNWQ